jgi:hypothetical protein
MRSKWMSYFCLLFFGCTDISEKEILGVWNALYLTTDSTTYFEEVEPVSLNFKPDNQYSFTGTLDYLDQGIFELRDSFLFLQSNHSENEAIKIKIRKIMKDTLIIEMKGPQLITFFK